MASGILVGVSPGRREFKLSLFLEFPTKASVRWPVRTWSLSKIKVTGYILQGMKPCKSVAELSRRLGISRKTIYALKKTYPSQAPKTFGDVETWRHFCLQYVTSLEAITRLTSAH